MTHVLGPLRADAPGQIGPYEILARLGAGGMGEVFLGRLPGEGAFVAVKTVRRDVANEPAFRDRFRREIKVAGLVRSAWAAAPEGGDADAAVPWLATAYVPGPSLSQAVRRGGALPVATVRELGAGIARALADLHGAGVLHRDLKPGNVMLSVDGPRLIDFGIARSTGATTMTATGMMVGTPAFMSPEHVSGARHVTGASDVFCLGSLLCYAATGEDPFGDGPLAAVLYRVSQAEADLSRVPEELRDAVAACLRLDPAERPTPDGLVELLGGERRPAWPESVREHIGEYGRELAQLVASGGPLRAVPAAAPAAAPGLDQLPTMPPVAPTAPPEPPRRKRRALIAAVVALAVVAGGAGTYLLWPQDGKKQPPAKAAPPAATAPKVAGVDDRGLPDASGVVPQNTAQRPAGWKPWKAKLSAPAFGCSAGESVLVCRTTDGRYEALDTASGKELWTANLIEDPRDDTSFIGPTGGMFIAGSSARPAVHGSSVVITSRNKLQVRDARTGEVRWEAEAWGAQDAESRPLVGDGMVFATTHSPMDDRAREMVDLTAFSLADGKRVWTKSLTNSSLSRAEFRPFDAVAFAQGRVYALSDAGLVAYDAKNGTLLGQVAEKGAGCMTVRVLGASAYCTDVESNPRDRTTRTVLRVMDAVTLAPKADLPTSLEGLNPLAMDSRTVVAGDGKGISVHDAKTGKRLARYMTRATPAGLKQAVSTPLLAGSQVVYADFSTLYTVRLGTDGKPSGLEARAVPGAPGARAPKEYSKAYDGEVFAWEIRAPDVLPIGGIAYLVYDQGAVASVELPK
ncbi:PQQ-binding-like beta-propeller repeat protein [Streptomyces sp. NPDC056463]|uniref:protein kinase domain-containing protein n=1 Tax=Streptomyces sp. NPDC056463 TaxID=3345827 RepID=UPI0036C2EF70